MKHLTKISRYLVGALFIFSGLVKANDTYGFSYKLEEYFVEFGMEWDWLLHLALPLAIFLVVLEVVLGVAVIVGYQMKWTAWALLLLIIFFSILTFASAQFGLVKSCGCFGDAIPLTPWESFIKDMILLVFILVIFFHRGKYDHSQIDWLDYVMSLISVGALAWLSFNMLNWNLPFYFTAVILVGYLLLNRGEFSKNIPGFITLAGLLMAAFFTYNTYAHLPDRDFRPYAVGKSIPEQMEGVPDKLKYYYRLENKETGEVKEFEQFPENYKQNWNYLDYRTEVIEKGEPAKIMDFAISDDDGNDLTEDVLDEGYHFLLIAYDLEATNKKVQDDVNELASKLKENGYYFKGVTASPMVETNEFTKKHNTTFEYLYADGITLKTIIRSNPGLVLLKGGVVKGKWHYNDLPDYETLQQEHLN